MEDYGVRHCQHESESCAMTGRLLPTHERGFGQASTVSVQSEKFSLLLLNPRARARASNVRTHVPTHNLDLGPLPDLSTLIDRDPLAPLKLALGELLLAPQRFLAVGLDLERLERLSLGLLGQLLRCQLEGRLLLFPLGWSWWRLGSRGSRRGGHGAQEVVGWAERSEGGGGRAQS